MDTRVIGRLVAMMESSQLTVMDVVEGEFELRLEKQAPGTGTFVDMEPMSAPVNTPAEPAKEAAPASAPQNEQAATPAAPAQTEAPAAAPAQTGGVEVKSPLVGAFHPLSASTDKADIKVGDKVKKGQVICVLEAMKLMNEIESDYDGEVLEVCAQDGDLVEYDQVLFRIKED